MLLQPVVDAVFQDGCLAVTTVALAVNDAHTANVLVPADANKVYQFMTGDGGSHAVHVELGTNSQLAAPELMQFASLNTGSSEKQRLLGGNFTSVEMIGEAVCLW